MLSALKEGAESRRWKKAESTDEKFNVYRIKNWNIHNNYKSGVSKKTLFKCSDLLSQNRNIRSKNEKKTYYNATSSITLSRVRTSAQLYGPPY